MSSRVIYDDERKSVNLHFDSLTMTATPDNSFSRVDVWVYVEPDDQSQDDPEPTPENTYWYGYMKSQYGELEQRGFDDLERSFTNNGELTSLVVRDYIKTIAFDGSQEEFDNLAVKVVIDGGTPEGQPQEPKATKK